MTPEFVLLGSLVVIALLPTMLCYVCSQSPSPDWPIVGHELLPDGWIGLLHYLNREGEQMMMYEVSYVLP